MSNTLELDTCEILPPNTLTVEQAQERILAVTAPLTHTETVELMAAHGRILAETVYAPMNVPPHRNSAMDGYALSHADLATHITLDIVGTAFAGHPYLGQIHAGQCVRIMTGAVVPDTLDSVVMQENVTRTEMQIQLTKPLRPLENVRNAGEDLTQGSTVLNAGRRLNAADVGLLASIGVQQVVVLRHPCVAFCSTGDELKGTGESLNIGDIYDSNRYTLHAMLKQMDVEVLDLGIIPDTPDAVTHAFEYARDHADVLITSGGVSVGEADYVTETLQRIGTVDFWKLLIKPGKPLTFGQLGECAFFGLPGNPVSAMVTFLLLVRPAILKMRGETVTLPPEYTAICDTPLKKAIGRKDYQRGICHQTPDGRWHVASTGNQGSHILSSISHANCFIALPKDSGNLEAGSTVTIIPFTGLL